MRALPIYLCTLAAALSPSCSTPQIEHIAGKEARHGREQEVTSAFGEVPIRWRAGTYFYDIEVSLLESKLTGTIVFSKEFVSDVVISKVKYDVEISPPFFGLKSAHGFSTIEMCRNFTLVNYEEEIDAVIERATAGGVEEKIVNAKMDMQYRPKKLILDQNPEFKECFSVAEYGYIQHYSTSDKDQKIRVLGSGGHCFPAVQAVFLAPEIIRDFIGYKKENFAYIRGFALPPPFGFGGGGINVGMIRTPEDAKDDEQRKQAVWDALTEEQKKDAIYKMYLGESIMAVSIVHDIEVRHVSVEIPDTPIKKLFMQKVEGEDLHLQAEGDDKALLIVDKDGIKEMFCDIRLGILGNFRASVRRTQ